MGTCASCGDDKATIHWRDYCHACCLTKPKYAEYLEGQIAGLQVWERLATQLWHSATPDPGDDITANALVEFLAAACDQLEKEQGREVKAEGRELEAD